MSLTRKYLTAMGIEADKVDEIIEAHVETVNAIKAERDEFKANADKLADVQKALDEANETIKAHGSDEFKDKYDALVKEFDAYKGEQEAKALAVAKDSAYRAMLKEAGISEKRIDCIMKVTKLDDIEIDGDTLKDSEKLIESAKTEWADFLTIEHKEGADTDTPPTGENGHVVKPLPTVF